MTSNLLTQITASIIEGEPDLTLSLTGQALAMGIEPLAVVDNGLVPGMRIVGEKFSCGEY
jgi:5-methyltetrahydrofolate--homocysteine methyltransferase